MINMFSFVLVKIIAALGMFCVLLFFFKQKTAYERRISDWSSDVCSSDLLPVPFDDDEYDNDRPPGLVAKQTAGDNAAPLTISEISALLKRTVEDRFGFVRLRGELSGVKRAASGHLYCALKDDAAVIDAVMWRGSAQRLGFVPEDGLEVIATGKITTYAGSSKYQIVKIGRAHV